MTPVDIALENKWLPMLKLLLEYGANIEQRCTCGSTPLLTACSMGYLEAVKLLAEQGANIHARGSDRKTCLQIAREKEHHSIVAYLLERNSCEIDVPERDILRLLQDFVLADNAASIFGLYGRGVDLNIRHPVRSQS